MFAPKLSTTTAPHQPQDGTGGTKLLIGAVLVLIASSQTETVKPKSWTNNRDFIGKSR